MEKQLSIEDYVKMPHTIVIKPYLDGGFFAMIAEFPGCMTEADTWAETYEMIMDAKEAWVEATLEMGRQVPPPQEDLKFSGRLMVRVPQSLHKDLALRAEREGTSLNQLIVSLLAKNLPADALSAKLDEVLARIKALEEHKVKESKKRHAG